MNPFSRLVRCGGSMPAVLRSFNFVVVFALVATVNGRAGFLPGHEGTTTQPDRVVSSSGRNNKTATHTGNLRRRQTDGAARARQTLVTRPVESGKRALSPKFASATQQHALEMYKRLPLTFEPNQGQIDKEVKFLAVGTAYTLFLTSRAEPVLVFNSLASNLTVKSQLPNPADGPDYATMSTGFAMRIKLLGSRRGAPLRSRGLKELPSTTNYFYGIDRKAWYSGIPHFGKVSYENVYPGIDILYHANQQQLEFDFLVAPGADPKAIVLGLDDASQVKIDARGGLLLESPAGNIRLHRPRLYQLKEGFPAKREVVSGRYVFKGARRVGIEVASYDASRPLIIDPTLSYSTFLGGSDFDQATAVAVDSAGLAYVAGLTTSTNFPTTTGAFDRTVSKCDVFVSKFNPAASGAASLMYSTYLGGSQNDIGKAIAVDSSGNAYVAGQTFSNDFPTTAGAFRTTFGGVADAFVTKLNSNGTALSYSTYLGGSDLDQGRGIALDSSNNAYVTGFTHSSNFPTQSPIQPARGSSQDADAFVSELAANGSALLYSTYLGGNAYDQGNGIAVDSSGEAYITGSTRSSNFPVVGALQVTCSSCPTINDGFVAKLGPGGSTLLYSTYLGGSGDDQANGIAVDSLGSAYVTGLTSSSNFPTTAGAFQSTLSGTVGAFVSKLNGNGSTLIYSTYLRGSTLDFGQSIAVISSNAYVTGQTMSSNFPTANPIQATCSSRSAGCAFVTELNHAGSAAVLSTYLGSAALDEAIGLGVDSLGNAYVAGDTASSAFPTANAFQSTFGAGPYDAFMAEILLTPTAAPSPTRLNFGSQQIGSTSTPQPVTLSNTGTAVLNLTNIATSGDYGQNNTCGTSVAAGGSCTINVTFTPTVTGTRTGTLTIIDNAGNSPQTVNLTGNGTGTGPVVSLNPTSLTFGAQGVGTTSASQQVTLSNTGTAVLNFTSIVASGEYAQTNTCGTTLAAGTSCTINVTFTPTVTGTRTGAITITDNAPNSPQTVNLRGNRTTGGVGGAVSFVQARGNGANATSNTVV